MENLNHPNQRLFSVRFLSPTNHRGARVKVTDLVRQESVTMSYDYATGNVADQAAKFLVGRGIDDLTLCVNNTLDAYFISSPNFLASIK